MISGSLTHYYLVLKLKVLAAAFTIALLLSGLAGSLYFGTVQAATEVSGIISSDTTWTQANSPYNLTGNTLVNNGVTLTIEAGVTVNLNNYYIMVNGTLHARGNSADPISFNGGQVTFTQYSNGWNESISSGCIIENSVLSSSITIYNSAKMNNDTTSNDINVYTGINYGGGHQAIISNSTIEGGISVNGDGMTIISNNTLMGQGMRLWCSNATVSGNTISGCSGITAYTDFWDDSHPDAWYNCTALIEGNLIANNTNGITVTEQQGSKPNSPVILNNTIANNTIGIYVTWIGLAAPQPTILNNNIFNSTNYNVQAGIPNSINATYNWWGTTNAQAINQTIYDFKNDFNLGTVTYSPFLTAPNTEAPTYIAASAGFGGSIVPSGIISVNYCSNQTFTITANSDYYISDVLVNGTSVGAVNSYTVQNIQGATTISAMFAPNVIPEFPSWMILPFLIIATMLVVLAFRNKRKH